MATSSSKKSATKKRASKKTPAKKKVRKKSVPKKKTTGAAKKSPKKSPAIHANHFVLKSVLAISDAKVLFAELQEKVDENKDITIDASAVEMIDTAILQLLLSFSRKVRSGGLKMNWYKPSEEFIGRAKTLNLFSLLCAAEAEVEV